MVEDGWPLRRAAERVQVSVTTVARWAGRYRELVQAGMADRSSRPHRSRIARLLGSAGASSRSGCCVGGDRTGSAISSACTRSTAHHQVLTRYGLAKLRWLDRPTGRVVRRIESARCEDLVHVDVKKLGKIPAGGAGGCWVAR